MTDYAKSMKQIGPTRNSSFVTLTFHGIGEPGRQLEPGEQDVWITRERFLSILDRLPRDGSVRITFDDGNASDALLAAPALCARGLQATFFVVAGRVGQTGSLSAENLSELIRCGMEIGSHGMWHRRWRSMSAGRAHEEILEAKRRLEDIVGRPVTKAACPFGAYDRNSLRQLRQAGFTLVYTSDRGPARSAQWLQARNTIRATDTADIVCQMLSEPQSLSREIVRHARQFVKRSYPW